MVEEEEDEEKVTRRQVEEDLRIYGSRPEPLVAVDGEEDEQLMTPSQKRKASELEVGVDHPNQRDGLIYNPENVTAMDWNAGDTPLSAWLNQSAIPAAMPVAMPFENQHRDPHMSKNAELLGREKKEIEVFKNIHIATASKPATASGLSPSTVHNSGLGLGAQIYYRNIEDRYPSLPPFLIRRLAIANHNRAERLQQQRLNRGLAEVTIAVDDAGLLLEQLKTPNPWSSWVKSNHNLSGEEEAPGLTSQQDFWTARRSSHRPSSVHSYSSSRNSSLRGSETMDSTYQRPEFREDHNEHKSPNEGNSKRGLFPAPIDWSPNKDIRNKYMFTCEICGELVRVNRRRDWQ